MKKHLLIIPILLTSMLIGCSQSEDTTTFSQAEDGTITVCGGTMKLGQYKGISLEKKIRQATDEEVESEAIDYLDSIIGDVEITNRGVEYNDTVTLSFTMTCGYDSDTVTDTIVIGDAVYGSDFDAALIGIYPNESCDFAITYPDDYEDADYAGKTYMFSSVIVETILGTYDGDITDDLIKEHLGYDTKEEFYDQIRITLNNNYEATAEDDLYTLAYQIIQDDSTFYTYSNTLWQENYDEITANYAAYMDFFGCTDITDIYDLFDVDEETIRDAALKNLYNYMITNAIANIEGITASEEEITQLEAEYMESTGCETKEELFKTYKEELFPYWVIADKVSTFIIENANISESTYESDTF